MATDAKVSGLEALALVERDADPMPAQVSGLNATGLVKRDPNPMAAQVSGFFAIALVSRTKSAGPFPLRLRQRGDNLNSPRLPRFHDSRQRTARLGAGSYW